MRMGYRSSAAAIAAGLLLVSAAHAQTVGVSDKEIVLGSVMDLSGPTAPLGALLKAGINFAFEEANEAGGIHGRRVRLIIEDSGLDPKKAIIATNKLLNEDRVLAIVAQNGSLIGRVTSVMAEKENRPFLFPAAFNEDLYIPPRRLVFASMSAYTHQTAAATRYAYDTLEKRRFCIFKQDDDIGDQVTAGVGAALKERGASIIETTSFKRGATEFAAHIARMRSANCDIVMLGTTVREAAAAAIERQKIGWDVPFVVNQPSVGSTMIALSAAAAEGVYGASALLPVSVVMDRPDIADLIKRFREKHGDQLRVDEIFFVGYVAGVLFNEGARLAGPNLTVDSLIAGLEKISNFDTHTPYAPMTFKPDQRLGASTVFLNQVKNGNWTRVKDLQ